MIEDSLKYLLESLSNYEEDNIVEQISMKIEMNDYDSEMEFIEDLEEDEINYLDRILEQEINYAKDAQDEVREKELNDIYELLF